MLPQFYGTYLKPSANLANLSSRRGPKVHEKHQNYLKNLKYFNVFDHIAIQISTYIAAERQPGTPFNVREHAYIETGNQNNNQSYKYQHVQSENQWQLLGTTVERIYLRLNIVSTNERRPNIRKVSPYWLGISTKCR